ncbi:MAG: glycosyltransferase family 2 protein [Paracoccaceae bacterium]
MAIGVVVVTYNASGVILDCLESLMANRDSDLRVVVVDNASTDDTVQTIRDWATGKRRWEPSAGQPFEPVSHGPVTLVDRTPEAGATNIGLIVSPENHGFAGGVNLGLKALIAHPDIEYFWVLNPDCVAENLTAATLESFARETGRFGVIGGRVYYATPPLMIQSDGGRINLWTGTCIPYNMTDIGRDVVPPKPGTIDYVSGAHMFLSRAFIERVGLMPENYFLYYEEMDWCLRRGDLPLLLCPEGAVHHVGGHTIGSATINQGPSPMAAYFMGRSRMLFVARFRLAALPIAFLYSSAKAIRHILRGQTKTGLALLRGTFLIGPSAEIRQRIGRNNLPKGKAV